MAPNAVAYGGCPWTIAPTSVAAPVDLGVEDGLEVHLVRGVARVGAELELDHVVGRDLGERHARALDPDPVRPPAIAGADVAEGQVLIALAGEDPAGPGDPLLDVVPGFGRAAVRAVARLRDRHPQRRSVGG